MKTRVAIFLLLAFSVRFSATAQTQPADADHAGFTEGVFQAVENAKVARVGEEIVATRADQRAPIKLDFHGCSGIGIERQDQQWWVLPIAASGTEVNAHEGLWVLPLDLKQGAHAWHVVPHGGGLRVHMADGDMSVTVDAESVTLSKAEARPHSDIFGHRFSLEMRGGAEFADALAGFYWGTMLPSVVEKTLAAKFPYSSGYVLSTLNIKSYAGSYPAVDHEFQIKGRLAMASELDLDVVRRMIELQFKLMKDDPEQLFRAPTSVQPNGTREYHVRRNSLNRRENAAMFPLTGDIEVIEECWRYYEAKKDKAWLRAQIENLEHAAGWILSNTDQYGRVWSDVYYEDQVMKDGRETEAQAFAAHAFQLLERMESTLGRQREAAKFAAKAKSMNAVLIAPLPKGYWDAGKQRFIDWVDRNGMVHDHIHLLANELPVLFQYATPEQSAAVRRVVDENATEFERFPTFLAAKIADYDRSEIGDGGPYDLCAAGRYWYWDAAYRVAQRQNEVLFDQLEAVAKEGARDSYFMSERYDMDHVYYVDGKNAHGAEKYYEYPNVFAAVLLNDFLGLTVPADADVSIAPHLNGYGSVEIGLAEYAVQYTFSKDGFTVKNLSDRPRRIKVDLSALGFGGSRFNMKMRNKEMAVDARSVVTLSGMEEARWTPLR